jgi:hypothetical protein
MTEAEWLACTDPEPMQELLRTWRTTSERKLRLFAAACCRRVWDWLGERSRRAVESLEAYVDGAATGDELRLAADEAGREWLEEFGSHHPTNAAYIAVTFQNTTSHDAAVGAAAEVAEAVWCEASVRKRISLGRWPPPRAEDPAVRAACVKVGDGARAAERAAQCQLLRDIFHGPRRAVYFQSRWRTDTVLRVAQGIYADRAFDRLPVVGDALEDAGCADEQILEHCRRPGEHVRGCWVVDLLLGKA